MSTDAELEPEERIKWSPWALAAGALLLLLFSVVAAGMMRGCFSTDPLQTAEGDEKEKKKKDDDKKKKDEQKEDVTIDFPIIQPAEPKAPLSFAKPGHWATATQTLTANFRDFVGDSHTVITSKRVPYPVNDTPFVLRGSRPVLLTKLRPKSSENIIFIPQTAEPKVQTDDMPAGQDEQRISLRVQLEERGLGVPLQALDTPITTMPSYQYHLVILAKESSRYTFLKTLDTVSVPFGGESDYDEIERTLHYRVVTMDVQKAIPLSANPLTWTSIAYILWDEVDPQLFTPDQERALVDWLHWGGQLIINGPDSIDSLKDSFLAPYLPADSGGARTIAAGDKSLSEMNKTGDDGGWLVSTEFTPGEALKPVAPWSGIQLSLRDDKNAAVVPGTGDRDSALLAERQVGRGRVLMSAMQLSERELINWRSGFESFFNGAVLRRPGRVYVPGTLGPATLKWKSDALRDRRLDAKLTTNLHYIARDLGVETAYTRHEISEGNQFGQQEVSYQYQPPAAAGGVGAWNDFSKTADAARAALREAAGVEVPDSSFVVLCLAVYLVALVPLNWLIFQTIGRVEWAWIAAPLIAIVGTFVVVNQAQLDIGFVRAQTEIGLLEQQPDYARSHLSRYTALYTSLSTTYDLEFENMTSLAAPFPANKNFQMLRGQLRQDVDFQSYDNVRLAGLPISSNSTGMVHSEQMVALDGAISKDRSPATNSEQIVNHSKLALRSVCVVKREGSELRGDWFGDLLPGKSMPVSLGSLDATSPVFAEERAAEGRQQSGERLNLEPMFRLVLDPQHIQDGETRLVARVDEVLPGEVITPAASQVRGATLVVAHLEYADPPPPERDDNTRRDVKGAEIEMEDMEDDEVF